MKNSFVNIILLFLGFCLIPSDSLLCQSKRGLAKNHIEKLSKGILLVRLDNREKEIELLRKAGNVKRLKKVKEKAEKRNEKIIAAFKKYYTFSDFCFYFLGESKDIVKDRNFEKGIFDDGSLCSIDEALPIYLLFFERKHWHMDNAGHWSFVLYELKKQSIKRLESPFPYLFETLKNENIFTFYRTRYDFDKGVKSMNQDLESFYRHNTRGNF